MYTDIAEVGKSFAFYLSTVNVVLFDCIFILILFCFVLTVFIVLIVNSRKTTCKDNSPQIDANLLVAM